MHVLDLFLPSLCKIPLEILVVLKNKASRKESRWHNPDLGVVLSSKVDPDSLGMSFG